MATEILTDQEIRANLCWHFRYHGDIPTIKELRNGQGTIMCLSPVNGIQFCQVDTGENPLHDPIRITCGCGAIGWQERSMLIGQDGEVTGSERMREAER